MCFSEISDADLLTVVTNLSNMILAGAESGDDTPGKKGEVTPMEFARTWMLVGKVFFIEALDRGLDFPLKEYEPVWRNI